MVNLDTHVLVFALSGQLRPEEQKVLSANRWGISAIVLWELAFLVKRGRIDLDLEAADFRRIFGQMTVWPIDLQVAMAATRLDFEKDPADVLIAATSVVYRVPLVTRDREIRTSALVPLAET